MAQWTNSATCGGFTCVRMEADKYPAAEGLATSAYFPVGREAGRVHVLLYRRDLLALDKNSEITVVFQQSPLPGSDSANGVQGGTFTFPALHLLSAVCVGGYSKSDNAVFLLTLVDKRHIARMSDTGDSHYNCRHFAHSEDSTLYLDGSTDGGSPWTWSRMIADLWAKAPVLGAAPSLPLEPQGVPDGWHLVGAKAWDTLCDVLEKWRMAPAYDPQAATFSIVNLGDSETTPDLPIVFDADPLDTAHADIAETVRVWFPVHYQGYGSERDAELDDNWSISGHSTFVDVPTLATEAVAGTVHTIWDDMPQTVNELGAPTNDSDLDARANELCDRYLLDRRSPKTLRYLSGLNLIVPSGKIRAVMWRNFGDGWFTEYSVHPGLPPTKDAGSLAHACKPETLQPPDLSRHSFPNYPRVSQYVQVHSTNESAQEGDLLKANADGFHRGRVRRWVGGMGTMDACWIRFVDFDDTDDGSVIAEHDRFYHGRLSGIHTDTGDEGEDAGVTLPVYLCYTGEQTFLAKPNAILTQGNTGSFSLYHRNPEEDSEQDIDARLLEGIVIPSDWCEVTRLRGGKWYAKRRESGGVPFFNGNAGAVPAYGVMVIAARTTLGGQSYYQTTKPNNNWYPEYLVNGPDPVASGGYGRGSFLFEGGPVRCAGPGGDFIGAEWGPSPGEWGLFPYRLGFTLYGDEMLSTNDGGYYSDFTQRAVTEVFAKMTSTITRNTDGSAADKQPSGNAKIHYLIGTDHQRQDAGYQDVTAYDMFLNKDEKIETDTWVMLRLYGQKNVSGKQEFIIVQAYCAKDNSHGP
jgi:hypothetical protein